jgi:hypothetical protein
MDNKRGIEGEEILGIVLGWIERGRGLLMKRLTCRLFFTTQRVIVAKEKRFRGMSFLNEPYYNSSRASVRRRLQMKEVSAEGILKTDLRNFDINYSDIAVVDMKSQSYGGTELRVFAVGDLSGPKFKFSIALTDHQYLDELRHLLSMILREKFDWRQ